MGITIYSAISFSRTSSDIVAVFRWNINASVFLKLGTPAPSLALEAVKVADFKILGALFKGTLGDGDPLGIYAPEIDGVSSMIIGAAANISTKTGTPVHMSMLLRVGLTCRFPVILSSIFQK
jgi:hypothetical protein